MRDGGAAQSNLLQVLLSVFNALANRVRNFAGLADAKAYDAVAVTDMAAELGTVAVWVWSIVEGVQILEGKIKMDANGIKLKD